VVFCPAPDRESLIRHGKYLDVLPANVQHASCRGNVSGTFCRSARKAPRIGSVKLIGPGRDCRGKGVWFVAGDPLIAARLAARSTEMISFICGPATSRRPRQAALALARADDAEISRLWRGDGE